MPGTILGTKECSVSINVRAGTADDLDVIVSLTRARRSELAELEPQFFRARSGADELHPLFLKYCLDNRDMTTLIASDPTGDVGCAIVQTQCSHFWVDDFCVLDHRWDDVGEAIICAITVSPLVLCCPRHDHAQIRWLRNRNAQRVSEYHSIRLTTGEPQPQAPAAEPDVAPVHLAQAPTHTFANGELDPKAPNALVIDNEAGYVIGTPPSSPPIYDPGGPTTIIDRIVGNNRAALLRQAAAFAYGRGDIQLVVVCETNDTELDTILTTAGSTVPVEVWRL